MSCALRRAGAGLAVLVVVAGCGSASSKSAPLGQLIVQATTGARTTRFTETVSFRAAGEATVGYEARGAVDFGHRLGELSVGALRPPSGTQRSLLSTAEWIGDDVYVTGSAGILGSGDGWTLIDTAKAHASSSPCLAHGDVLAEATGAFATDPTTALDTLREHGTILQRVGSNTIRGVATTHLRAAPTDEPTESCSGHPSSSIHEKFREIFDIWIDDHDVARRLEGTSYETTVDTENGTHTTTSTTVRLTTDFYDLGAPVTVNAPPARLVHDGTAAFIAAFLGPGTTKSSDWHVAAQSASGTPPWTVYTARTSTGWECYDAIPAPDEGFAELSSDYPEHDGHPTTCSLLGADVTLSGPVQILVDRTDGDRRTLVGVVSAYGPARLELADGSSAPLTVDPDTQLFSWTGPATPRPVRVHIGTQACRVDGHGNDGSNPQVGSSTNVECLGPA